MNSSPIQCSLVTAAVVLAISGCGETIIIDGNGDTDPGGPAQCDDGIDNDQDGLTDWQLDLGCFGAEDRTEGGLSGELDNGWTVLSATTCISPPGLIRCFLSRRKRHHPMAISRRRKHVRGVAELCQALSTMRTHM